MKKIYDYFDERYRESVLSKPPADDGPVITIARLTGCDARQVAEIVVDNLNRVHGTSKWHWIDKDIIHAIARELNTEPPQIESFYEGKVTSDISEMIKAFSGGFVTSQRVKKAMKDVVLSMAREGHLVLVGRGGVSIARDIADALHVRLIAPFYWRVENVMKKKGMTVEAAEEYVIDTDEKRFNLIQTFLDKKSVNIDHLFDVTVNRSSFTIKDTADLIVNMYEKKSARIKEDRKNAGKIV